MADGMTELAKMLKDRNNKPPISFELGTVKSIEPLIIKPDRINIQLDSEDLIKLQGIVLMAGSRVALLPAADMQTYLILGVI